jgi:hypothetical protein
MRTLKMLWNSETGPLACRWVESENQEGSEEVLTRVQRCGFSIAPGDQASTLQPARPDWDAFFSFRLPAFPQSFGHPGPHCPAALPQTFI